MSLLWLAALALAGGFAWRVAARAADYRRITTSEWCAGMRRLGLGRK